MTTTCTCPIDDRHRFNQCAILSCKNFSPVTDSYCIVLDREDSKSSKISDSELQYFKGISSRSTLVNFRKQAEERITILIILDKYIKTCKADSIDAETLTRHPLIYSMSQSFPFSSDLWPFPSDRMVDITDQDKFNKFRRKNVSEKASGYTLDRILGLKPEALNLVREIVMQHTAWES